MNTYSPNFFKDDFSINKNRFKNGAIHQQDENKSSVAFKVEKVDKVKVKKEKRVSFKEKALNRINLLKEYLSNFTTEYFNEKVV